MILLTTIIINSVYLFVSMATQHGSQELLPILSRKSSSSSSSGSSRGRRIVLRSKRRSDSGETLSPSSPTEQRGHIITSTPLRTAVRKREGMDIRTEGSHTSSSGSACSDDDISAGHFLPPLSMLASPPFIHYSTPVLRVPVQASPTTPSPSPLPQLLTLTVRNQFSPNSTLTDEEGVIHSLLPDCNLKIFVGTWNMHEEKTLPGSINDFILPVTQDTLADVYAIGTQESTPNKNDWEVLLQQTLGLSHVLIHSVSLGCIYLCVFIRRDLIWFCSGVQSSSLATRAVTAIKTKGAVAVRFNLFGSSFLFITSHFSAGFHNVHERNADVYKISNNLTFPGMKTSRILESHDYVFWFGDFNYRVELERDTVDGAIQKSELMSLLLNDQLTREILAGNVFNGFSEQPISFPPSYKFDLNSYCYDTSELVRVPSWTDRVLFLANGRKVLVGCGYDLCPSILISDHRPVYAVFNAVIDCKRDLVTEIPASYNRDLYIKALQRRRQLFSSTQSIENAQLTVRKPNHPPLPSTNTSNVHNKSSSVCHIL